jgi:hypothetical protein
VVAQLALALRLVAFERIQVRRGRYLRVHHDVAAAGEADDHVRREPGAVGRGGFLEIEVAVLEHAGRFDDAAELELAPLAPDVRRAQRLDEPPGFDLERLLRER